LVFILILERYISNSEKDFDTIHIIWYNALRDFEEVLSFINVIIPKEEI